MTHEDTVDEIDRRGHASSLKDGNSLERSLLGRREYVKLGIVGGAATAWFSQTSATVAASGTDTKRIFFDATGDIATYNVTVSGTLADDPLVEFDAASNISGSNAEGTILHRGHGYRYSGELTDVQVNGESRVYLSGESSDVSVFGPPGSIRLVGRGTPTNYDLTVFGELSDDPTVDLDVSPNISGRNAEGTISAAVHSYRFFGDLADLRIDGHADVFVHVADI